MTLSESATLGGPTGMTEETHRVAGNGRGEAVIALVRRITPALKAGSVPSGITFADPGCRKGTAGLARFPERWQHESDLSTTGSALNGVGVSDASRTIARPAPWAIRPLALPPGRSLWTSAGVRSVRRAGHPPDHRRIAFVARGAQRRGPRPRGLPNCSPEPPAALRIEQQCARCRARVRAQNAGPKRDFPGAALKRAPASASFPSLGG